MGERAKHAIDVALRVVALGLTVSLAAAAWHDVSKAWDVWSYHLPFAARIVGIIGPDAYVFDAANQARFSGFPLLAEALQGLLWKITGRPECTNLVAFAALPGVAYFLKRAFDVPLHVTMLALLGIPLVQIHATASYIDLPANACATLLLLCAYRAVVSREPPTRRELVIAGVLAAATANAKFQLVPIVLAACAVLVVRAAKKDDARTARLLVIFAFVPLVFATPLKNLALHGNPVWPIALGPLPHVESAYSSSPPWLEHAPRPIRFVCSALEIGSRPIASHRRWSIDQWTPPSDPGYRMGGFCGAYVVVNLAALASAVFKKRSREAKVGAAFVVGLTAVVGSMPQSHELRYYMTWMIFLVTMNAILWAREAPVATGLVALAATALVAWSTEATYLYPSGDDFATLVKNKTDVSKIVDDTRACVAREPWTFLYAAHFHAGRSYVVEEAEEPTDCP